MATNDLTFLLVFIVLPTALIVSGFWAMLFIKKGPRRAEEAPGPRGRRHSAAAAGSEYSATDGKPADQTTAVEDPAPGPAVSSAASGDLGLTGRADNETGAGTETASADEDVTPDEPDRRDQVLVQPTTEIPMVEEVEGPQPADPNDDPEMDDTGETSAQPPEAEGRNTPQQDDETDHRPTDATKPQTSELGPLPHEPDESKTEDSDQSRQQRTWSVTRMKPSEDASSRSSRHGKSSSRRVHRRGRRSGRRHER